MVYTLQSSENEGREYPRELMPISRPENPMIAHLGMRTALLLKALLSTLRNQLAKPLTPMKQGVLPIERDLGYIHLR